MNIKIFDTMRNIFYVREKFPLRNNGLEYLEFVKFN